MRTFVLSDIHGQYDAFLRMLKRIKFKNSDKMYVLGDVIDRGVDGVKVIRDLMGRANVEMFMGNHELMMLRSIEFERSVRSGELVPDPYSTHYTPYELWTHPSNGGTSTHKAFYEQTQAEQDEMEEYLRGLHLIRRIVVEGRKYHLSHSYSINRRFGDELFFRSAREHEAERIVWDSLFDEPNYEPEPGEERPFYYKKDIYIVGHVFTQRLGHVNEDKQGLILTTRYRGYSVINMDCGLALRSCSSRLGCMLLETGEEFYEPLIDGEKEE